MSAESCQAAFIELCRKIPRLRVLGAEPSTIQAAPFGFVWLSGGSFSAGGQVKSRTWRFGFRVCVDFQDNVIAESLLAPYADHLLDLLLADLTLGGRANVVPALDISSEGEDGYYATGDPIKVYRSIVFRFEVRDKK